MPFVGSDGPVQSSCPWAWEFCILCVIKISTQKHFINRYWKVCVHCLSSSFGCYWNPAILSPRKQTPYEKLSFGAKENYVGSSEELVQWLNLDKITPWCFPSPLFPPNDINALFFLHILWKSMSSIAVLYIDSTGVNKLLFKRFLKSLIMRKLFSVILQM